MYRKYRVILFTRRGKLLAAASDTVNNLDDLFYYWLNQTPAGRSVYDDQIIGIALYQFDEATGQYINVGQKTANSRKTAAAQLHILGAR